MQKQPEPTPKEPGPTAPTPASLFTLKGWSASMSAIGAILLSILIGSLFLLFNGYSPLLAYENILIGAFGDKYAIAETLLKTTPLLFTGLAVAIAFQAGLFNIGAEGQLLIGALAAAMVALMPLGLPAILHAFLALGAGFIAGGIW